MKSRSASRIDSLELLDAALRKRRPGTPTYKSFVDWYFEARFGIGSGANGYKYLDGSGDNGVDAAYIGSNEIILVQAKYSTNSTSAPIPKKWLDDFAEVARHLKGHTDDDEYRSWLKTASGQSRRAIYQEIRRAASAGNKHFVFVFVTTRTCDIDYSPLFRTEDRRDVTHLWALHDEALGPPFDEITLPLKHYRCFRKDDVKSYVGFCDIKDILDSMIDAPSRGIPPKRLFNQNVRTYLGNTPVNTQIAAGYVSDPEQFWLRHNGIYIIAARITGPEDRPTLHFPSVVNGAQTLWSLYNAVEKNPARLHRAEVIVRILETSQKSLRDKVIRATNNQNAMSAVALLSHHESVPEIARRLDGCYVFLERLQREWVNHQSAELPRHEKVSVKDLLQWISAVSSAQSLGSARNKVKDLLSADNADRVLKPIIRRTAGTSADTLYLAVASGLAAKNIRRRLPKPLRNKARIASLATVHLLAQAMGNGRGAKAKAQAILRNSSFRSTEIPAALASMAREMIEVAVSQQRKTDLDLSNFFKSDDRVNSLLKSFLTARRRKALRAAAKTWGKGVADE